MSNLLMVCVAVLAMGSRSLRLARQGAPPATWEFVSGWERPEAMVDDWMPNHTESQQTTLIRNSKRKHDGIAFITPTHLGGLKRASLVQNSWTKFVDSHDLVLNVVDPNCQEDDTLKSVVILPRELLQNCEHTYPDGSTVECNGYHKANVKHIFGVVQMVRQLQKKKSHVWPEWWIMKDDDTYINVHNLKTDLAEHNASMHVILASKVSGTEQFFGGAGAALSWQLVEDVALNHGSDWINGAVNRINGNKNFYYDKTMAKDLKEKWVKDLMVVGDPHFQHLVEGCGNNLTQTSKTGPQCHVIPGVCDCARSDAIATWHIGNHDTEGRVKILEKYEKDTRK